MQSLSRNEMKDVVGGGLCTDLMGLTAGSCFVGFAVACVIGLTGYVAVCLNQPK
jgi:hypothetical protein